MRPKVLIITNRLVIGGPSFHVADLASGLQGDFDIQIVGGEAAKGEEINLNIFRGLEHEPIMLPCLRHRMNPWQDMRAFFAIRSIIREFQPDIIHTHTSKPGLIGRLAAKRKKVKLVHTFHGHLFYGYFGKQASRFLVRLERFLAKRTHALIALSPKQKKELVDDFKIEASQKVHVIFPGINAKRLNQKPKAAEKFHERYSIDKESLVLGIVGRLVKIKNVPLFIRGIAYLKQKNYPAKGLVVGDGPEKKNLKALCISLGLSYAEFSVGNQEVDVIFLSWSKDMRKVYPGIDLLCLTSHNEGTPYSLLEAQMMGKAVLSAKVGGVEDIVIEGKTAMLYEKESEYFALLENLVSKPALRNQLAKAATDWSSDRFNTSKMLAETKKLYSNLLQS